MRRRLASLLPFARYQVEGESMTPALAAGERVVVNRAAYWFSPPRPGDLVVLHDPRDSHRMLVKRIETDAGPDEWLVRGDNASASTDSRSFGPVSRELIVGKVWFRY